MRAPKKIFSEIGHLIRQSDTLLIRHLAALAPLHLLQEYMQAMQDLSVLADEEGHRIMGACPPEQTTKSFSPEVCPGLMGPAVCCYSGGIRAGVRLWRGLRISGVTEYWIGTVDGRRRERQAPRGVENVARRGQRLSGLCRAPLIRSYEGPFGIGWRLKPR